MNLINKFFPSAEHIPRSFIALFFRAAHAELLFLFMLPELPNDTFSPDWLLMASIQYFINSLTDKLQCRDDPSKNEYTTAQFIIFLETKQEYLGLSFERREKVLINEDFFL